MKTKRKMKTIVVMNQKGGVGKTTVARHLAFYGIEQDKHVLAVDLDPQGVAANFSETFRTMAKTNGFDSSADGLVTSGIFNPEDRRSPTQCADNAWYVAADAGIVNVERADLAEIVEAAKTRFAEFDQLYDVCVVDTGPSVLHLLVAALAVGDFAVSPCKPDRDAIAGLAGCFSNIVRVRDELKINPRLASLGVLPNQISKTRAWHRNVLAQMREEWGDGVLPVMLHERAAIDMAKDRPVWRTARGESTSDAATEMKVACAHIYKRMGL